MSDQVKAFTETQVQEMVARGAGLGLAATIRFALDADIKQRQDGERFATWALRAEEADLR
jgi:hypothetical protein